MCKASARPRLHARSLALAVSLGAALASGTALTSTTAHAAAPPSAAGPDRTVPQARPETEAARACSTVAPVCVHVAAGVPQWAGHDVLRAAESAIEAYRALGLPAPLADGARGGSPAYDVYVGPEPALSATLPDPESELRAFDQTAAYTLLPTPSTWGCELGFEVARHAAHAIIFALDAGAERGMVAATASYLASIVAPCAALETPAIDALQAQPYRAFTDPSFGAVHGGLLFPMYLEENEGSGDPGRLTMSLFSIASQRSIAASKSWQNEPDIFDALRSSLRFNRGSIDDLLLDFAVDRAFVGDRSDGAHLSAVDLHGKAGRVFFEWSVPYGSLPRRLAPLHPLEPTGATYLWVDLADAPKDAEITFVADWELPAVLRWSLVKVDKSGGESGRIDIAGIFGSTHVERTLVLRDELAGILVVGTFTGSLDRGQPFDPDDAPFMPHSYEVTLYK